MRSKYRKPLRITKRKSDGDYEMILYPKKGKRRRLPFKSRNLIITSI